MMDELEQMMEISDGLLKAASDGDIDRVVALLKRRKGLTENMEPLDPNDENVKSGKAAEILKNLVDKDGEIEVLINDLMVKLQTAMTAVQGEKKIVRGYLQKSEGDEPKLIDREG
ncbi:MAG TPA: flagellar protein FliT [bacterium]|jgi:hypothetical protein